MANNSKTPEWAQQLTFQINDEVFRKKFEKSYLKDSLKLKAYQELLTLEDILDITPKAFIRIYVSAMDSFTDSKRVFKSKSFYLSDIKFGSYQRYRLDIITEPE